VLAAVLLAIALVLATAAAAAPAPRGTLAIVTDRTGNLEIFSINADGTNAVNLTNSPAADNFPAWSPDGARIVSTRGSGFGRELWLMGSDGSNQARLTTNTLADVQPQWSPDGSQIAFVRFGADQNRDIWVMNADGSGDVKIVDDPAFFDIQPDWSPDGKLIAFMSDRGDGLFAIYTVRPDGSHTRRLSPDGVQAGEPAWSPDGREIAFEDEACGTCEESDLFVMNANGGPWGAQTRSSLEDADSAATAGVTADGTDHSEKLKIDRRIDLPFLSRSRPGKVWHRRGDRSRICGFAAGSCLCTPRGSRRSG
jgi:Tol biopolymer transport system component